MKAWIVYLSVLAIALSGCIEQDESNSVTVYVSHDQEYSEPILKAFEEETGIKVNALYDTETTKTTGLVNKLIAEKDRAQADVFWNNEVSRTLVLKNEGVLEAYCSPSAADIPEEHKSTECYWSGFGGRARVILYNTELVNESDIPISIYDLADSKWKGKTCIANPLFGSTASHVSSLFAYLGDEDAKDYFISLKENDIIIAESNGQVKDLVSNGKCAMGLTDTDDANDAVTKGMPVALAYTDQDDMGTLIFPNTVMLIRDSPNQDNGKKLVDYILSREVEEKLAFSGAKQIPLKSGVNHPEDMQVPRNMQISPEEVYGKLNQSQKYVQETFIT